MKVTKTVTSKPIVKDNILQFEQETIEYTEDNTAAEPVAEATEDN